MPVDQLAKISRYVGAGGGAPDAEQARRQVLGDDEGARPPRRAGARRRAAQPLRRAPQAPPGHAFPEDSEWLREFEDELPLHRDAPTSARRSSVVKADMERARPMDRLICGDVGYGKTEVALRAAFKAADDGKQVLVLAPTTILAQQHFGNFSERLKDYPFTIEHVSPLPHAQGAEGGRRGVQRRQGRHPDRHPPPARPRRARRRTSG